MTEQEVRTLLTDALVNLFEIEPERIKPETNLYEDLEIDSIEQRVALLKATIEEIAAA